MLRITPTLHHSNTPVRLILAFETSCDETAIALWRGRELVVSEVASQVAEHEKYGGVVPEVASRNHLVHVPRLLEKVISETGTSLSTVDAFAATSGPGLASSLMIGASLAKGLAIAFARPYLAVNHLEGHLLSPFFGASRNEVGDEETTIAPNVALIVSGGHTLSVLVRDVGHYEVLGRTVDDAAGEAFDKVAKMLGLGYPGGPEIEKHARDGDSTRFEFPRSMPDSQNFSFSGLKTAVRYLLPKVGIEHSGNGADARRFQGDFPEESVLPDICASFQQAVIDVLVRKTIARAKECAVKLVTLSGGVSCNQELRRQMEEACRANGLQFMTVEKSFSTDNAAMIAFAAALRLERGETSSVTEEIDPNLALA